MAARKRGAGRERHRQPVRLGNRDRPRQADRGPQRLLWKACRRQAGQRLAGSD